MKLVVYGVSAIITLIVIIALLGTINSFIKEFISDMSKSVVTKSTYCVYDSDCSPSPSDCNNCYNIYSLALGLIKPCQDNPIRCVCENNMCVKAE